MDDFAKELAKKAKQKDTAITDCVDTFKALTAYYIARHKVLTKKSDGDDDDDSFSFGEKPNGRGSKVHSS